MAEPLGFAEPRLRNTDLKTVWSLLKLSITRSENGAKVFQLLRLQKSSIFIINKIVVDVLIMADHW